MCVRLCIFAVPPSPRPVFVAFSDAESIEENKSNKELAALAASFCHQVEVSFAWRQEEICNNLAKELDAGKVEPFAGAELNQTE